jgi:hypothetical protein
LSLAVTVLFFAATAMLRAKAAVVVAAAGVGSWFQKPC